LPLAEDEDVIVWPQIVDGIRMTTPVDVFCSLFADAPDTIEALQTIDQDGKLGFRPYLEALGYGTAEITQ